MCISFSKRKRYLMEFPTWHNQRKASTLRGLNHPLYAQYMSQFIKSWVFIWTFFFPLILKSTLEVILYLKNSEEHYKKLMFWAKLTMQLCMRVRLAYCVWAYHFGAYSSVSWHIWSEWPSWCTYTQAVAHVSLSLSPPPKLSHTQRCIWRE